MRFAICDWSATVPVAMSASREPTTQWRFQIRAMRFQIPSYRFQVPDSRYLGFGIWDWILNRW
ncbi:MAG: hypothetical protein IPJ30_27835 [Acidobacteria bacterium]|nr:hypothetical protein [Acidobacteriota bacterium]